MRNKLLSSVSALVPGVDYAGEYRRANDEPINAASASRKAQAICNRINRENPNATELELQELYRQDETLKEIGVPGGHITEDWLCIDCGVNTAPGFPDGLTALREIAEKGESAARIGSDSEVYMVRDAVWKKAGMGPFGGCLCIGCLERRIGRRLKPKDFPRDHSFNSNPGTPRLLDRRS